MTEQADPNAEKNALPPELQGEMWEKSLLDPDLQKEPGLVSFTTADGVEVCPADQFTEDLEGYHVLRPELSALWAASRVFDEQLGLDALVTLWRFKTPQEEWQGRSWWDVLAREVSAEDLQKVREQMHEDLIRRNEHSKDSVVSSHDPRTDLPKV